MGTGGTQFLTGGSGGAGGEDAGPDSGDPAGGTAGTAGSGGSAGGDAATDAPVNTPGAPVVGVVSPEEATDPDVGPVITENSVDVTCLTRTSSQTGSNDVDPSSVRIQLADAFGPIGDPIEGEPTSVPGEYSATVFLTSQPNGPITLRCSASDTSEPALIGEGEITTFVDHGPAITFTSPIADNAYAVKSPVPFDFDIAAAPLASGDAGAAVTSIVLLVNGVDVTPAMSATGEYDLTIPLSNQAIFPNTPTGDVPVRVIATNARGVERVVDFNFVADGAGPQIVVASPAQGSVVGGPVTIAFSVTDALSGTDPQSVNLEFDNTLHWYDSSAQWTKFGDAYSFTFDSRNLAGTTSQVTINILATDNAGNVSTGTSVSLYIDNFPPIVDLDPGNVREFWVEASQDRCSNSFDPLGISPNDLEGISEFITRPRTLVWDQTNQAVGQTILYYAFPEPSSVYLYLQPTVASALLVDNDNDPGNVCDELAVTGLNFVQMQGLVPSGNAMGTPGDDLVPPLTAGTCDAVATYGTPLNLCVGNVSDLTRVIRMPSGAASVPVVYAAPPLNEVACTGDGWEIGSMASEGWLCLAARAVDKVGNVGISPPLRVCYDDGVAPLPGCMTGAPAPTCTDGCVPPPGFGSQFIDR